MFKHKLLIFAAMLSGLQRKWKVSGWRFVLIIITFAIGGSLTGFAGRKLMVVFNIANPVAWTLLYIIVISVIWPLAVLLVSIPFGQFNFFKSYLKKMGSRMGLPGSGGIEKPANEEAVPVIAIFASGTGTNAEKIIQSVAGERKKEMAAFRVGLIVCNKPGAGVLGIAARYAIPVLLIEKEKFFRGDAYLPELRTAGIDFVVLAGFLWKIPLPLVNGYANRIINIHPALLPKYGGKGMYGQSVHEAVIKNGDPESGITIHWVDEHYDHGSVIFQAKCPVLPTDTPSTLASRIHQLEHEHFPAVVARVVQDAKKRGLMPEGS